MHTRTSEKIMNWLPTKYHTARKTQNKMCYSQEDNEQPTDVATSFPRDSPFTSNGDGLTNTLYH